MGTHRTLIFLGHLWARVPRYKREVISKQNGDGIEKKTEIQTEGDQYRRIQERLRIWIFCSSSLNLLHDSNSSICNE